MKKLSFFIAFICISIFSNAQIGYQVSLLNTATGEPRANERVTAKIELSNSDGEVVYSETQTGVTNDFGVLSLTIGNAQSLSAIDWSKYPMFISVTVDNVLIGRTQVMSVPYANAVVPLDNSILLGTWRASYTYYIKQYNEDGSSYSVPKTKNYSITFLPNGTVNVSFPDNGSFTGTYFVEGNTIICILPYDNDTPRRDVISCYYSNGFLFVQGKPALSK